MKPWRDQFEQGRGPLFWASAIVGAAAFYIILWATLLAALAAAIVVYLMDL